MDIPLFTAFSSLGLLLVVAAAAFFRGRLYATFAGVLLGIHTLISTALYPHLPLGDVLGFYLQAAVYLHFLCLVWPRMRPWPYRLFVSLPASWFVAGTFLALPWALVAALGLPPFGLWLPYALCLFGLVQSLYTHPEAVDLVLDGEFVEGLKPHTPRKARVERPLKVVQITDPHLGPFMSESRLRRICERAVAREPDLILLTGDFLTMESQGNHEHLARALAPLRALPGRVFACRGNHDLEAPETVARGLAQAGVRLLIDEAVQVETGAGPVEVLGIDFVWRGREAHIASVCARYPRRPGVLRLVLLHDPSAFRYLPEGQGDLVFSGHTHGGQVGLVSVGFSWTMVRGFTSCPDHGFWARSQDRLYVHRGTGHYGFPLRLGVPAEESFLRIHPLLG